MSEQEINIATATDDLEQVKRDFLNALFGALKALALYDLKNDASERPLKNLRAALDKLRQHPFGADGIELKYEESVLTLLGNKIPNHFSIVEASKVVPEFMEVAMIEAIKIGPQAGDNEIGEFLSKWALHTSVHQKPKPLQARVENIRLKFVDPKKSNMRLKTKELLMSPSYALQHYFFLRAHVKDFFDGISQNEIRSQKKIRRSLVEIVEIAKVHPYQLVALSLIETEGMEGEPNAQAVSEALSTSMLSIVMAKELEFSLREQVNIGMAALMFNIGLLTEEMAGIVRSDKKLSQVEYKRVLEAQSSGVYKLLKVQGASRPVLERLLALFEATQGAQKQSISLTLESRLLRLVSAYVALTSRRPYRDAYTPFEAMKLLGSRATSKKEGNLDPVLYYVFVRLMGVYPVGSLVQLSNNKKAVVYRAQGDQPGIPMVKIIEDSDDMSILVDLSTMSNADVVKQLDAKREGVHVPAFFFD